MVDECLKYAVSAHLKSRNAEDLLATVFYSWIQYFGPMEIIAFDQEGGITSDMAVVMCEKFNIARDVGGSHGHGGAPVAEKLCSNH